MMKVLGLLSISAVSVVVTQEVQNSAVKNALEFDHDILQAAGMFKFGSDGAGRHPLQFDISAALYAADHDEVISSAESSSFRRSQAEEHTDDMKKCHKCVYGTEKYIMKYAFSVFQVWCGDSSFQCPFMVKLCSMYKTHPKVIEGYLFGQVDANNNAWSYCIGKKECPKPDAKLTRDATTTTASSFFLLQKVDDVAHSVDDVDDKGLYALSGFDNWLNWRYKDDEDDEAFNKAKPHMEALPPPRENCDCGDNRVPAHVLDDDNNNMMSHHHDEVVPSPFRKPSCDCVCKNCVHHMTNFVLHMTIDKVNTLCQNKYCPRIKATCDWAEKHQDQTIGFLFSKVTPWQGAIGWCYGAGHCTPKEEEGATTTIIEDEDPVVA